MEEIKKEGCLHKREPKIQEHVIVSDRNGKEYEGKVVNVNDFREPDMKYAVDIGLDDVVFVGRDSIRLEGE